MKTLAKIATFVVLAAFTVLSVQGCNTVRGVGKDIEKGGQKIQGAATK